LARAVRARFEGGILKPLEDLDLEEGEEVILRVERISERKRAVEEFYGKLGPAPKDLLDEFMLEAEEQ
jgi:predicted DNA-binding antitoxin AbrB/MazE fold protein